MSDDPKGPPVVDPSPTAPPIHLGSTEYVFPPAAASPPEILALKPNTAEDATEGPHPQIFQTAYVHMSRPDGSDFLAPLANVEHYAAKGFVKGATEEIEDLGSYWSQQSAAPKPATSTRSTSAKSGA